MCLRATGIPGAVATFSVEAVGQVYKQPHDFVYLGENAIHDADLLRSTGTYATPGAASVCPPPRTVPPTECSYQAEDPDAETRSHRDNAIRTRHIESKLMLLRYVVPSPPQPL